ncbi:DNA-packaging protein FI [Escherichia coli]
MTKEQMTERLQALAVILGREADISGSKADLEQRLAEWEEEAVGFDGGGYRGGRGDNDASGDGMHSSGTRPGAHAENSAYASL